jgi:hypothetical protein
MPSRVTDPTQWCLSTAGLRWARNPRKGLPRGKDSVDLIGSSGRRPSLAVLRHNLGMKKIWSLRPQGTSAKNWSPDLIGAAVITFEWIAQGFTVVSFWTAPWRLITGLEDR